MSLINDALRKAQTNTEAGRMRPVPVGLTGAYSRPQNKSPFLVILTAVLVLGIIGWGIALFFTKPAKEEEKEAVRAKEGSAAPAAAVLVDQAAEIVPEIVSVAEVTSAATEVEAVAPIPADDPIPAESVAQSPLVESPVPVVEAAAQENQTSVAAIRPSAVENPVLSTTKPDEAPEVGPSDEIIFTLKRLDITAVMGEGKNARIMLDGQIHKVGELINLEMKIRFHGKKGAILFFTDEHGQLYEKPM